MGLRAPPDGAHNTMTARNVGAQLGTSVEHNEVISVGFVKEVP